MVDVELEVIDLSTGQSVGKFSLTLCEAKSYELDTGNYRFRATYLVTGVSLYEDRNIVEGINPNLTFEFLPPLPTEEIVVVEKINFNDGITPYVYVGDAGATYNLVSDPLGTDITCQLIGPTLEGRSCLRYFIPSDIKGYGKVRITLEFHAPQILSGDWIGLVIASNRSTWTIDKICALSIYGQQLRINYIDGGTSKQVYAPPILQPNTKYKVEARISIGAGIGEIELLLNDSSVLRVTGLNNTSLGSEMNAFEIGGSVLPPAPFIEYITSASIYGKLLPTTTVTLRVVDSTGVSLRNVGVRVGYEPGLYGTQPWVLRTYGINGYTDINGVFSFTHTKTVIPEIKLIKLGYGDAAYPVGSITKLTNIDLTQTGDIVNLGDIILNSRVPISATPRQQGKFWAIRAIQSFPYLYPWGSEGHRNLLRELKTKNLAFNLIDIRWSNEWTESQIVAGIQEAHEEGYGVLFTASFNRSGSKDEIKAHILNAAQIAADNNVEYFNLGWETWFPDDGTHQIDWQEILSAVRQFITTKPEWKVKVGTSLAGYPSDSNFFVVNAWVRNLDYIILLKWNRNAPTIEGGSVYDPTESDLSRSYDIGAAWWEPQVNLMQFYSQIKSWLGNGKLLAINLGVVNADGGCWRPWGFPEPPYTVTDFEEQALFYKVAFDRLGYDVDGFSLEHYSFDFSETILTGNWRNNTLVESFIREGLLAHSIAPEEAPFISPTLIFLLLLTFFGGIGVTTIIKKGGE